MIEEKARILKMLEEGKIGAEDAAKLMDAIEKSEGASEQARPGKTLKIKVYENDSSKPKVNLNIPIGWSKFLMPFVESKIQGKLKAKGVDIDMNKIKEEMENAHIGKIIDIDDGGDKVEIYIE
jgi:SHOCT-like domain